MAKTVRPEIAQAVQLATKIHGIPLAATAWSAAAAFDLLALTGKGISATVPREHPAKTRRGGAFER